MNLNDYSKFVNARYTPDAVPMRAANLAANAELVHALLGLNGEVGELTDEIKKHLIYNRPLDRKKALLEAGDVLHYLIRVVSELYSSLEEVADMNVKKITDRDIAEPNRYGDDAKLLADLNDILLKRIAAAKEYTDA